MSMKYIGSNSVVVVLESRGNLDSSIHAPQVFVSLSREREKEEKGADLTQELYLSCSLFTLFDKSYTKRLIHSFSLQERQTEVVSLLTLTLNRVVCVPLCLQDMPLQELLLQ